MTVTARQMEAYLQEMHTSVIAIDPGDEHVGVAFYGPMYGVRTTEWAATTAVESIDYLLGQARGWGLGILRPVTLVVERFVLYPHSAGSQSWSPMKTSEMIGALKYVARCKGVTVVEQGANIKKPTRQQLKARGIRLQPLPEGASGDHARDAEKHLWYYLLRNGLIKTGAA